MATTGYSGKPLYQKLGVKDVHRVLLIDAPEPFTEWLQAPFSLNLTDGEELLDYIHVFVKEQALLKEYLPQLRKMMQQNGMIWVSWPKKASKVQTNMSEDQVRALAFPLDLVDVKVCSVSDVWSGLKLMIRKEKRR